MRHKSHSLSKISQFIKKKKKMETWRVRLTATRERLTGVNPERGILEICALTISPCYSVDATQPHSQGMH